MPRRFRTLLSLLLLAAGCSAQTDPTDELVAADGEEAMIASSQSTSLGRVVFENVTAAAPKLAAAQLVVAGTLPPSSCITRTLDPSDATVVHVTFTDCTGPLGLVHIDGAETVSFMINPSGRLQASVVGVGLTENGKPVTHSAMAEVTVPGATTRTLSWDGKLTRTSDTGETVTHESDLLLTVDRTTRCRTSSGNAATMIDARKVSSAIQDYELCEDVTGAEQCPTGSVTHTGEPSGRTITVSYGGQEDATVTGPSGNPFELPLTCTPAP